eukprot:g39939.t1
MPVCTAAGYLEATLEAACFVGLPAAHNWENIEDFQKKCYNNNPSLLQVATAYHLQTTSPISFHRPKAHSHVER